MFNTKYPIVSVGMNQVSDLNLALAVSQAGGMPTISGFNYSIDGSRLDLDRIEKDFQSFLSIQKHSNFIFGIDNTYLIKNKDLIDLLIQYKVFGIELIVSYISFDKSFFKMHHLITRIIKADIKIIFKTFGEFSDSDRFSNFYINKNVDALLIKSHLGAGGINNTKARPLLDLTKEVKERFKTKFIISSGGVSTPHEVKNLIEAGAGAIGIGTLFAASNESLLSPLAKQRLVDSSFSDIKKLNMYEFQQNALIFSSIEQDRTNNTKGLKLGIKSGTEGHILAGKGIDNIDKIRSVKEIIEDLCSLL